MGQILNGVYTKGIADLQKLQNRQSSTWKQWSHKEQRSDHSSEIVQPYDREGKPSEKFIDNYPEEAVDYGFVKSEAEIIGNDSGTEVIDKGATEFYSDEERIAGLIPEEDIWEN